MEWLSPLLLLWLLLLLGWTGLDLGLLWLGFLHLPGQIIFQLRIGIPFTIAGTCSICEDFYFSVPCVCIGGWCSSCQYWGYFLGVCEDMEAFCQAFFGMLLQGQRGSFCSLVSLSHFSVFACWLERGCLVGFVVGVGSFWGVSG